jgi:hypothetical protein
MRPSLISAFSALAAAAATFIPIAGAQATTYTCPATSTSPAFNVQRTVLINTEQTVPVPDGTLLPDGIVANNATLTTGRFVEEFTNPLTKYSIAPVTNGPNWFTFDATTNPPDAAASGTAVDTGNNVNLFGPASEAALTAKGIHVPVISLTSGLLTLHVVFPRAGTPYVDDLSLIGRPVDGCALLRTGG